MKKNILQEKSEAFGKRIVNLYKFLQQNKEYLISNQILRSGTSIGANICESIFACSVADFVNKLHISRKEMSETYYWLTLLESGKYITKFQFDSLAADCEEIGKLLTASIKTAQKNLPLKNNIKPNTK